MAKKIRSLDQLPARKRPGVRQLASARSVKRVESSPRLIRRRKGRKEIDFGEMPARDVAGTIKDFRLSYKEDLAAVLKDENGNVFARTYFASARTTIPEALVIKALSKYGYGNDDPVKLTVISFEEYKPTKTEKISTARQRAKADRTPIKQTKKVRRLSPTQKMQKRVAELEKEWKRKTKNKKTKGKQK